MGIRCADHVTPLYPQKLALTSPTGGGRSVGIVRSRTKATEFTLVFIVNYEICYNVEGVNLFAQLGGSEDTTADRHKMRTFSFNSHPPLTETALTFVTPINYK